MLSGYDGRLVTGPPIAKSSNSVRSKYTVSPLSAGGPKKMLMLAKKGDMQFMGWGGGGGLGGE